VADILALLALPDPAWGAVDPVREQAASEIRKLRAEVAKLKKQLTADSVKFGGEVSRPLTPLKDNYA
jgi:hypothetical protein